jgi:hypothetical protein
LKDAKVYTLAELAALVASSSDAETEAALASVNADVRLRLMDAFGGEAEVETKSWIDAKVYTLAEMVALLVSSSDADTEAALLGASVDVRARLMDACGVEAQVEPRSLIDGETKPLTDVKVDMIGRDVNTDASLAGISVDISSKPIDAPLAEEHNFREGDKVEVFSMGQQKWVDAMVTGVAFADGMLDNYETQPGTVAVQYADGSIKYVTPENVSTTVRKVSIGATVVGYPPLCQTILPEHTTRRPQAEVFQSGEEVEVFSEGQGKWVCARVAEFALTDCRLFDIDCKKGTVVIEYKDGAGKCITPDQVASTVRRIER